MDDVCLLLYRVMGEQHEEQQPEMSQGQETNDPCTGDGMECDG